MLDGDQTIRVTAVIPVYNGEATVRAAIDSALAQEFSGFEIVVVNDGSTDSTLRILDSYGSDIRVVNQTNRGLAAARNAGANAARGEFLAFLDADDIWLPEKLEKLVATLDSQSNAVLAFSDYLLVSDHGQQLGPSSLGKAPTMVDLLSRGWGILPSTVVIKRTVFDQIGGFCKLFRRAFEDLYLLLLARERGAFAYVPEVLMIYYVSPFTVRMLKYESDRITFNRLVRERYGSSAKGLLHSAAAGVASAMLQEALQQMDRGNTLGGLAMFMRLLRSRPLYLFRPEIARRYFRASNLRRLLRTFR